MQKCSSCSRKLPIENFGNCKTCDECRSRQRKYRKRRTPKSIITDSSAGSSTSVTSPTWNVLPTYPPKMTSAPTETKPIDPRLLASSSLPSPTWLNNHFCDQYFQEINDEPTDEPSDDYNWWDIHAADPVLVNLEDYNAIPESGRGISRTNEPDYEIPWISKYTPLSWTELIEERCMRSAISQPRAPTIPPPAAHTGSSSAVIVPELPLHCSSAIQSQNSPSAKPPSKRTFHGLKK